MGFLLQMIRFYILCLIVIIAFSCEKDLQIMPAEHEQHSSLCLTTDCVTEGNVNVKDKSGKLDARVVQSSNFFKDSLRKFLAPHIESMSGNVLPAWKLMVVDELAAGELLQIYVPMITEQSTHLDGLLAITANKNIDQYSFNFFRRDRLIDLPALAVRDLTSYGPTAQYDRGAALALFDSFNSAQFGVVDADLHAQLNYKGAIPAKDDCVVKNYIVTSCFSVYGGANRERYLYTDCKSHIEYGVGVGDCDIVSRGGSGGGGGGGGSRGGLGNGSGGSGSTTYVNNRDRCAEDGVGCEEDDEDVNLVILTKDSIGVGSSVRSLKCASSVLTDYLSLKNDIRTMVTDIFGPGVKFNLTFEAGYTGSNYAIHSVRPHGQNNEYGFSSTITLSDNKNSSNCTRDMVLSTIVHETLHAYYQYLITKDGGHKVNSKYPLFVVVQNNYMDHYSMAEDYVDKMANLLREYNPRLSPSHATHLAWAGLEDTPAYKRLESRFRGDIESTVKAATCRDSESVINSFNFQRCN